jgi:hypothetical protein
MLRKFKYIIPIAVLGSVMLSSCKKGYFDINVDPNNPSTLPVQNLLTNIETDIAFQNTLGGVSGALEVLVHRITQREEPNAYVLTTGGGIPGLMWNNYYISTLTNADIIIDKATTDGNFRYRGIAKIIKAFAVHQLVDLYGDVPFTEASKLFSSNIRNPKFDDDATIYPKLFTMIDEGIADLMNTAVNKRNPAADDVIYQGNVTKWIKAGNTLKLKMYTQVRKVQNVTAPVTALLASPSTLISSTSDNFQLNYTADNKNPGVAAYAASQRGEDISPWFYEIMKGYNPNIFNGIVDPRIPYYWYNQLKPGQTATNDNNPTEYRDGSFVSIYFASNGPDVGFSQQNTTTVVGLYPGGGKYDNGAGAPINVLSATGAVPGRMITYADRLFLEAELINTGVVTGDARAVLQAAITEAFKQVDNAVTLSGTGAPLISPLPATAAYITSIMLAYDNASTARKLEIIMTQKWISSFGSAVTAYTDYRRTGYPIMFDPSNPAMAPGGFVQPPINGNPLTVPQKRVPVSVNRAYPLSILWPTSELDGNPNAPKQKEPGTYKVFWQP